MLATGFVAFGFAGAAMASGDVLVAGSVCEAHELRFRQQQDSHLQIEIPAEFDKQWPSRSACESARLAWDPEAPGPKQPIPFSHKHHAGQFGMDCQYCHSGTDRSAAAGVPSTELCMGCHAQFPAEYDEIEGIRILKEHWESKEPIKWEQIHRLRAVQAQPPHRCGRRVPDLSRSGRVAGQALPGPRHELGLPRSI